MVGTGWGRRRARTAGARWPARLAVAVGVGSILFALVAPPAGANYGRVAASAGCDRVVNWTASASSEGSDDERTNERVLVEYRPEGAGDDAWRAAGDEGSFEPDNDFSFSGSFELPDGVDAVDLRVTPKVAWGADRDGDPAGDPRFSRAELPEGCADQPIVASITPDCDAGGALVRARNVGDGEHAVTVFVDGIAVRDLVMPAAGESSLLVPVLEDHEMDVRVAAGDFVISRAAVAGDCGVEGPAAVVIERCAARQAVVLATASAQRGAEMQVRLAGTVVHRAEMDRDRVLQRTVELADEGTVPIEISIDGEVRAVADVGGCDGEVAGAVSCGNAGRPDCSADDGPLGPPPPPPPPATIDLGDPNQGPSEPAMPVTGPWERGIALMLGGGLLLSGGLVLASDDRRRPRPSPVADALAPYRQRWWQD